MKNSWIKTLSDLFLVVAAVAGIAASGLGLIVLTARMQVHAQTQNQAQSAPAAATPAPTPQISQPPARPQPAPAPARAVIFLDPAHGGPETGASLGGNVAEKDVTLAFAGRLHSALVSAGFNVVTSRDSDLPLPTDQRAEAANRAHALACIVIHATATGTGLHLYTSTLLPAPAPDNSGTDAATPFTPIPWEAAQAGFVDQSRRLSDLLKATLSKSSLPVLTGTAPLRPLDNVMCPAVAIEIAPNAASISASDGAYQQQIVFALASALQLWRDQNAPASPNPPGGAQ